MTPSRRAALAAGLTVLAGCAGTPGRRTPACPVEVGTDATVRVGVTGDVMLGRGVNRRWRDGPPAGVWDGLADHLDALDGLLVNLECTLSSRGDRRPGRGFYFRAHPEWAVPALRAAGTSWAGLANNHVLDFGRVALADTLSHLADAGIATSGAGMDRTEARRPAVLEVGPVTVAVVALTDQASGYAARPESPGTAYLPLDATRPDTRRRVQSILDRARKGDPDLLMASLHWGPNWDVRPSRDQQLFARWLVEEGVDVVHGHSAHVIQGVEVHRGRPIIYDAGDFVDDYAVKEGLHNDRSFLFELEIADGVLRALVLRPVEIDASTVRPATDEAAGWLRARVRTLSAPFGTTFARAGPGVRVPLARCRPGSP